MFSHNRLTNGLVYTARCQTKRNPQSIVPNISLTNITRRSSQVSTLGRVQEMSQEFETDANEGIGEDDIKRKAIFERLQC